MEPVNGFVAKHGNLMPRHAHAVRQSTTISTTFHCEGLEIALSRFQVDLINSVGGVY